MGKKSGLFLISLILILLPGVAGAVTDTFVASGTWIAPAGVTSVTVEVWGGGGGGGGNPTNTDGGGGGGGGAYSKTTVAVTPGNSYTVTVGAGGVASTGAAGGAGGDSWFSTVGIILARGGTGGNPPVGGAGGVAGVGGAAASGVGTTKFSGGAGGTGRNSTTGRGGPGGSSAGTAANGTSGPNPWSTATAAAAPVGGGIGGNGGNANGQNGFAPASGPGGGGGGGAERNTAGGAGADGLVTITYTLPAQVLSINRANPNPTSAATVSWTVTFSNSVTSLDPAAFTLAASGVSGAFVTTVTGSGTTWTVTANTGIGAGTLGLNQTGTGSTSPALSGTFTGQVYTITATPALAEYRMDEAGWSGVAGEVVDTSGSYPGTAINSANTTDGLRAIPGNPGTCRYGVFDNGISITQGYVALPGFPNLNSDFTITAWIRTTNNAVGAQRILIDDESNTGGYGLSLGEGGTGVLRFYARGTSAIILDTPNVIASNTWYFIAGVADISNSLRWIYVYDAAGNLLPGLPVSVASTGWGIDAGTASIGGETNASGEPPASHHFVGNLDEVRVYQKVLNQSALAALATQTHACAVVGVTPGGFNAYETSTAAGAITGVIKTKIAGSAISTDVIALNTAKTAIQTSFTGTVRVEILDSSNNSGALDANNCRPTWSTIQTLSPDSTFVTGDNGRKTISFTVPNAYRDARVRITYPAGAPTVTGCSTDNFAIRPSTFTAFGVSDDGTPTNAGTTRALNNVTFGAVIHKAGRPLSVRASAVNAVAALTTNYTGTPGAVLGFCAGAACTAATGTLSLSSAFTGGQLITDVASYDNVGSFSLQLVDSTFAAVDNGDGSTTAEREVSSAVINVGRFVPNHFSVALTTPVFGTACVAGAFAYAGQKFTYTTTPVVTLQARNFANGATTFYTGSWWRITSGSLTGKAYTAASGTLDASGVPGTDPVILVAGLGSGSLTFSSGTGLSFTRSTPVLPFDAEISLAINLIDADGVVYEAPAGTPANPVRFGQASAGNGIAFSSGKQMRFGRLHFANDLGSPLLPLQINLEAQYWASTGAGSSFITNTADSCTAITAANIAMANYQRNLNACESSLTVGGFSSGRTTVQLSPPGTGNAGSVDLTVNLGASGSGSTCISGSATAAAGANRDFLRGDWTGAAFNQNPTGRAVFGVYPGSSEVIYSRENY